MTIPLPGTAQALWTTTAPAHATVRPQLRESYDAVVVGAGITGLTTAVLLAQRGVQVLLVERRTVGAGTSGRSTAKATVLQGARAHRIEKQHGRQVLADYVEGNRRGLELIADTSRRSGVPHEVRAAWSYATSDSGARQLSREQEVLTRAGLEVSWETSSELPFPVSGAIRLPDQLQVDPAAYLRSLADTFVQAGGHLVENLAALGVDTGPRRPRLTVHLGDGTPVQADWVVLATLLPFPLRTLLFATSQPMRSYLLATEPADADAMPTGMYLSVDQPTRSLRTATAADGSPRLLIGGNSHPTGHGNPTMRHVRELAEWGREHFGITSVSHRWSAQDYRPADLLPQVGPVPYGQTRLLVASGFDKWGFTNGSAAALALADTVTGHRPDWSASWTPRFVDNRAALASVAKQNAHVTVELARGWLTQPQRDGASPPDGQGLVERRGITPRAVSTVDGTIRARSAVCTHLGGIVRWNEAEATWDCPLHGSRFGPDGSVLCAPTVKDLPEASGG
jgi:glycine/D-amino acid oxidase-like deaminating enzyme/nitrite reductase/ring-hydroxylating ferredoxin subunit